MLNIITGRAGSGKTTKIINKIIADLNNNENENNLILFVPEQMSFQAEYEIAKKIKGKTYTRLQVFSFKRLAHRLFLEVGGLNKIFINDLTVDMMISKILQENVNKFQLYNRLSGNYNFVTLLHEAIKEFKSYQVSPEVINNIINSNDIDETFKKKLHDINTIYTELIKMYGAKLIDNEDFYAQLSDRIKESEYLKNAEVYIDGYHSYTTVELNVIYNLIKYCKDVTILFTLDNLDKGDLYKEDNLFNLPYRTLMKITNYAKENNIDIKINHLDKAKRFKYSELEFLEKNYDNNTVYEEDVKAIEILECENPTSEVHNVARMIYNDVIESESMYSDYVIYLNNQEIYYPLIKNIFKLYNIPVFIDDKKLMLDHSLLNFIDASLEVVKTNFSYEAIFRAIKTEMFMPLVINDEKVNEKNYNRLINEYRNRIDLLENFCLSHGINNNLWFKEHWDLDIYKKLADKRRIRKDEDIKLEELINETKNEISIPLIKFYERFKEADCVKEQVTAIYELLDDLNIEAKLDLYEKIDSSRVLSNIDLNNAKKHKQVYNKLMELFDELVEVCGNYIINTNDFIKVLQTGFKGMKFAIVPPAIDQVMVGTLKRSRFEMMGHFDDTNKVGVKKAFVLGVNENEIPKIYSDSGLITNKEREFLINNDIEIMPTIEKAFLDENFIIYTVLLSASENLFLSYTLSNSDKKEAYPSEIIEKMKQLFPKLKVTTIYDFPSSDGDNIKYVTSKNITSSMILQAINSIRKGYQVNDIWKALYNYFNQDKLLVNKLVGVKYVNEPSNLDANDVNKVYSNIINASISSVEKYNSCPYSYFLEKGLDIKRRDIQQVESMDIGDLYHETMKEIAYLLIKNNENLNQIDLDQIPIIVDKIVDEFAKNMQRKYFYNNNRNKYLLYKIKQSLIKSLQVMHYQCSHSKFQILAVEENFGYNAPKLKVEPIVLSNGFEMRLKGFIDRIDVANLNEKTPLIRIIDYKSGDKDIDFTKIYNRLSLQLFTYLDVVLNNSVYLFNKEAKAAGVLYYHIKNSEIQASNELTIDEINNQHNEEYRMNGYTVNDKMISQLFDDKLGEKNKSDIIKVTYTKNGYHKVQSKVLDEEEINALRKYTKKAIIQSIEEITQGCVDIKPVLYNNVSTCKYCEYHSICKFDPKLKENKYNEIAKVGDREDIINLIMNEFGSDVNE